MGKDTELSCPSCDRLKREVEELRKYQERIDAPMEELTHNLPPSEKRFLDNDILNDAVKEIQSLKKSIAEVSQERDVEIRRARIAEAKLKESVEVIKFCLNKEVFPQGVTEADKETEAYTKCRQFLENNK